MENTENKIKENVTTLEVVSNVSEDELRVQKDELRTVACKLLNDTMKGRTPQEVRRIVVYLHELTHGFEGIYAKVL